MNALRLGWRTALVVSLFGLAPAVKADTIVMKNGDFYEGIILAIENGVVRAEINQQPMTFGILEVDSMNFDTPHLLSTGTDVAMDHFLSDIEAQEIVESFAELDQTAEELEALMEQVRLYWEAKEPIESREVQAWEAARDRFRRPLSRYQEILNDLYFHVLARVDEYNAISHEAGEIYVGVRGIFNIGSPLLPNGMEELPPAKYVPRGWYDTIYYEGYNIGYNEAYLKIRNEPAPVQ